MPWQQILVYLEAIVRVYNLYGRRDNLYKARIKILVKAEGQKYFDAVNAEFAHPGRRCWRPRAHHPGQRTGPRQGLLRRPRGRRPAGRAHARHQRQGFARWLERNVHPHRVPGLRAVTLSLKRLGIPPGDTSADVMDTAAALADRFSLGERVSHRQNLVLPWVKASDLSSSSRRPCRGFATPNAGLLTDQIACPAATSARWPMRARCHSRPAGRALPGPR